MRKKLLVISPGNCCRSQMAHGYLRLLAENMEILSAGSDPVGLDPKAVVVMREDGVDISDLTSNSIQEYTDMEFDFVLTLTDGTECTPTFNSRLRNFEELVRKPSSEGNAEQVLNDYRKVRDTIREFTTHFVTEYINVTS